MCREPKTRQVTFTALSARLSNRLPETMASRFRPITSSRRRLGRAREIAGLHHHEFRGHDVALHRRANLRGVERQHFFLELGVPGERAAEEQVVAQCSRQRVVLCTRHAARLLPAGFRLRDFVGGEALVERARDFFLECLLELREVLRRIDGERQEACRTCRTSPPSAASPTP